MINHRYRAIKKMKSRYSFIFSLILISIIFVGGCTSYSENNSMSNSYSNEKILEEQKAIEENKIENVETTASGCIDECQTDTCEGFRFISCEWKNGCYKKNDMGIVIGKCGVECKNNEDCSKFEKCENYKCVSLFLGKGYSRENPLSLNTPGEIVMGYEWDQLAYVKITVTGIKRGSSAWSMIKEANMFNDPPQSGKEYLLAKIKIEVLNTSDNRAFDINPFYFEAVSESGIVYENVFVVEPEPEFDGEVYPGGSLEGWKTFQVDKTDSKPLLRVSGANDVELWFKLY